MFLNKRSFLKSLKFRMALCYALLFFVSCLFLLGICSYLVNKLLNNAFDANARRIARRTAELYILGRKTSSFQEIRSAGALPAAHQQILEEKFPAHTVLFTGYFHHSKEDAHFHTAIVHNNGKYYEMRVQKDNSVYSKQLFPAHNTGALRHYFSQLILNRGKENISLVILDRDDSVYLESSPGAIAPEICKEMLRSSAPQRKGVYRYSAFQFADGRKLLIALSLRQRLAWLADITLIGVITLGGMTLAGVLIAFWLTRHFIRGVKETTLAMNRISSGDYSYRLQESAGYDREIQELTATFNAMNERTENLLSELRTISDNVAHDLRTPLTRISGTVELLLSHRDLPEDIRNDCVSVAEEISRLKELVNILMDISRTNLVPGALQMEKVNLSDLTANYCDFMQVAFEEKGLDFSVDLSAREIIVSADRNMFLRLLSNLLGNALKFTEKGFVSVVLSQEKEKIRLSVKDSGCGISAEDQRQIFKRFFRSDASRHLQGNGLGLSLVEAIVKAHKWEIALSSAPGKGTVFTVTIPRE